MQFLIFFSMICLRSTRMKIAQYVETFSYVGMFNTMNFASYICLYLISLFMQHPVYRILSHDDSNEVFRQHFYYKSYTILYFLHFPRIIEFVWSWALNRLNNICNNNQSNFCSLFWCPDADTGAQHPSPPPPAATCWPPPPPPPLSTGTAGPASSWNMPE